ncbi:MAG: nucleoside/nucleotide kinase family protein [Planctomycetota bacterium]
MTASYKPIRLTDRVIHDLAAGLVEHAAAARLQNRRFILGIAGVAGSGKSTLAERLVVAINEHASAADVAVYAPMDGFHLRNDTLEQKGWVARKGAPFTYDASGYVGLLQRYRDRVETGDVPVYSREKHESVPGPHPVTDRTALLIAEGQYLLLTDEPWQRLAGVLDQTWWLDTPEDTAKRWTIRRHVAVGRTPEHAAEKYENNDGPNSRLVREHRRPAHRVFVW